MKIKITILAILMSVLCGNAHAAFLSNQLPTSVFGSDDILFGFSSTPSDLCNYYERQLIFDATTDKGKNMLSILLAAKLSGKKIDVWYTPSTSQGTTHDNGCSRTTMGILTNIGISD